MLKRIFDLNLALLLVILLSPILLIIYILVRVRLGSPAIFIQQRPGLNEHLFKMYKFRSMTDAYDSNGQLLPDGQRLTSFGKALRRTSLDELPQLWNILKGEMSFIGPRPMLAEYLPLYNAKQRRRLLMKPGITGWAQVHGRNNIAHEERFKYDVWYIDHHSIWLDIKIFWLTFLMVIKREGINQPGFDTYDKFTGNK